MSRIQEVHAQWMFQNGKFHPWATLRWTESQFIDVQFGKQQKDILYEPWVLLPGFVNLHTHLELTSLRNLLPQKVPFPEWVGALKSVTQSYQTEHYHSSWLQGAENCRDAGTMTVVDVGNSSANWNCFVPEGIRILALKEMIGLDPHISMTRWHDSSEEIKNQKLESNRRKSFCAHAPFSCSPDLLRNVYAFCKSEKVPFFIHISESRQEQELYDSANGLYRSWIDGIYRDHEFQRPIFSSLSYLDSLGISMSDCILVHGNTLQKEEHSFLRQVGTEVVHCPQSAEWFGHPEYRGEIRCLGTDSMASSHSLSQWDQLVAVQKRDSFFTILQGLLAISEVPGQAIQTVFPVGKLEKGYLSDWQAYRLPENFAGTQWNWLLQSETRHLTSKHFGNHHA